MGIFGTPPKKCWLVIFFWGGGGGVSESMDCTPMKMLTFMDGPLQNVFKVVYYNIAKLHTIITTPPHAKILFIKTLLILPFMF